MNDSAEGPHWVPTEQAIADANTTGLAAALTARGHGPFDGYEELHRFSIENQDAFWSGVWDFANVIGDKGTVAYEPGEHIRLARFFPGARLNFAENLLRARSDEVAIIERNEAGDERRITRNDLFDRVGVVQGVLTDAGVQTGDRVAIWLPNIVEAYVIMLAATGLGAVVSTSSPDFGVQGVLDRFAQIDAKVLFAGDAYHYGGKEFDCLDRLAQIRAELPTVARVFVVPVVAEHPDISGIADAAPFAEACAPHLGREPSFERLPFDHPLYILFSSGTTGAPKSMVHRAGGVLLQHLKEQQFSNDIRSGDRVFFFTTTGWMMWNWLASVLASDASIVVYDGNPAHPSMTHLFDIADELGVTLFGTSAKFIESLNKAGVSPVETHGLDTIRRVCSTGSPLSPEGYDYVRDHIGGHIHLASISGGTDLCGCLVGGNPIGPVFRGEIQRPLLGLAIDVVDDDGVSLPAGTQGELVCRSSFPSMPLTFLGDDGDDRYFAAYFERLPGMWHQGDFAEWTNNGGIVIHGRSDATLNPGGVRIGTAEIYGQLEKVDEVLEGLVIGQQIDHDTRIVLFVRMRDGAVLDDALRDRIRAQIRSGATPRHVPAVIVAVADIPRTRSGKLVEIAVRSVVHGRPVKNREALANPEALELFADLPELA